MIDDARLSDLLRRADKADARSLAVDTVTDGVVRKGRRRVVVRRAGAIAAALAIASGVAAYSIQREGNDRSRVVATDVKMEREGVERLDAQVKLYLAMAARAEAAWRVERARGAMEGLRLGVSIEQERAATTLLSQADWRRSRGEPADAEYRRVIELFGSTRAADAARGHLNNG